MSKEILPSLVAWLAILSTTTVAITALECSSGFGTSRVIPDDWINDGFCDCPWDAADEPKTNACSGSTLGWAGIGSSESPPPRFTCPQQPKLQLPLSRINDSICDCCDGADEVGSTTTSCPDICDEVLASERAARVKMSQDYEVGKQKRADALKQFAELEKDALTKMEQNDQELSKLTTTMDDKWQQVERAQLEYMDQRRRLVLKTIQGGLIGDILKHLSVEELATVIQYACQLNAEMDETTTETCVALRLAGVDVGLVWDREAMHKGTASLTRVTNSNREQRVLLAKLVHHNADGDPTYLLQDMERKRDNNKRERPNRRRLDEIYDDDYLDDDYPVHEEEDDIPDPPPRQRRNDNNPNSNKRKERHGKRKELQDLVEASPLSMTRKAFLEKSDALLERMEVALSDNGDDENGEPEGGEEEEKKKGTSMPSPPGEADPMALTMGRTALRTRQKRVEKGFDWAVSAKILTDAVMQQEAADKHQIRTDLWNLAGATLFYSDVSSEHVWHIITLLLEESGKSGESSEQQPTCSSPLADLCSKERSRSGTRNGTPYPPESIQKAGEAACQRAVEEVYSDICPPDDDSTWPDLSIPQGLYGYYTVEPRPKTDPLEVAFAALDEFVQKRPSTDDTEDELRQLEKQRDDLEKDNESLEKSIGGRTNHEFGDNGELHALHDQCFSVDAGKYTYEVCPFAKAHQRDVGQRHGGTSLGNWVGMEYNEDGERVLKWDKGQKCWNGPNRSVSVIVRCGAENKVLTADEPQTCTYLLEMESFIACDEAFYDKHIA